MRTYISLIAIAGLLKFPLTVKRYKFHSEVKFRREEVLVSRCKFWEVIRDFMVCVNEIKLILFVFMLITE